MLTFFCILNSNFSRSHQDALKSCSLLLRKVSFAVFFCEFSEIINSLSKEHLNSCLVILNTSMYCSKINFGWFILVAKYLLKVSNTDNTTKSAKFSLSFLLTLKWHLPTGKIEQESSTYALMNLSVKISIRNIAFS